MTNLLRGRRALLLRHRWVTFLLPLVVFLLLTSIEPKPEAATESSSGGFQWLSIPCEYYPWVYTAKIVLTLAAVVFVLPGYREFPFRVGWLAVVVGVVGGVVWIVVCRLDLEHVFFQPLLERVQLGWIIGSGARSAFNPFVQLGASSGCAWTFLAVRFLGLVAVVPVIEEFFLRGFLMRFVVDQDWWQVPFGKVNATAVVVGTAAPMLMHPGELLAAAVWFTLVTWLMVKTRNIWGCIAAHAITNLMLGVYVVSTGRWQLM